jgi:hypothetical protein
VLKPFNLGEVRALFLKQHAGPNSAPWRFIDFLISKGYIDDVYTHVVELTKGFGMSVQLDDTDAVLNFAPTGEHHG